MDGSCGFGIAGSTMKLRSSRRAVGEQAVGGRGFVIFRFGWELRSGYFVLFYNRAQTLSSSSSPCCFVSLSHVNTRARCRCLELEGFRHI